MSTEKEVPVRRRGVNLRRYRKRKGGMLEHAAFRDVALPLYYAPAPAARTRTSGRIDSAIRVK